ncbi:hypothetical protein HHK36_016614 [Tetracentron sinense]|uniref:Uncharacterized protein n=1 Tax=Tetracentron sinense TaxID=13715 RepID=A0A834Z0S2_TETSI|nr:hypothetical protein HHK36_016614 [Tetracentron sinense]
MRRGIFISLVLVIVLGIVVYLRLWAIDYTISSQDTQFIRSQFDLANKEAMDESAEWRLKYDEEVKRATMCVKELIVIKQVFEKKVEEAGDINTKLTMLQKENIGLLDRVESLNQELEGEKLKCSLRQT